MTLHLNAFLMNVGHHEAAWRLPESDPFANIDIRHYQRLAQIAERGKLDSVFLADSPVLWSNIGRRPSGQLEPTVLLTALAAVTEHIGLIATASTTYNEPYNLARRFASVDHVSNGRAGWNIVTTAGADAARNFNLDDLPSHRTRYERAAEFIEVSLKLWDSWDDTAPLGDKDSGVWGDQSKLYPPAHSGEHFKVAGALNLPRSPQGYPLLVQAGSSDDGKELAARYAEAVFTAQQTLEDAQEFYRDLKARVELAGRDPSNVKILPGIVPVIGSSLDEALELEASLEQLIVPEHARAQLATLLRVPAEELALDAPLPASIPDEDEIEGAKSRFTLIVNLARRENLTVRQLIGRLGGGRGHRTFAGTPVQVADAMSLRIDRMPQRYDRSLPANAAKVDAVRKLAVLADEAGLSLIHLAIAFVLQHPAVTSAIIGPRTLEHLESQLGAAKVTLSADLLDRIDEIVPPGVTLNPADAGYQPPSLTDPALRRRPL